MRRYEGLRQDGIAIVRVLEDDRPIARDLDPRLDLRNHSAGGFEWGYGGSGPSQLALALCVDALDGDIRLALRVYQEFKWQRIAPQEGERWTLTQDEALDTIRAIAAAKDRYARQLTQVVTVG